ncbi:SRPBCC family protein [Mucilaginibacter glaciei]|uniref:SRPBCC family protein n=1 Tax=Mucilaginibacter glaciei TaxID=2772109 RepID=A0A926S2R4_9SPHI|nr:SRPBCC family protein [Mucilaginibacter glaciei]MBD1393459.1 SRPBCC family protein [Mucilaginibacter glaciei]
MNILTTVLEVIATIVVLVLVIALFVPKAYNVQRNIIINKASQQVFDYVKFLRNQDHYSKWVMMDPNKRMSYKGTDGTVGYTAEWDSDMKQAGKGEQTITRIVEGERVDIRVVFIKPFAGIAETYISTEPAADASTTMVVWNFDSKMAYPMNFMLLFMSMEKMLGKDMEESLANLKRNLEA